MRRKKNILLIVLIFNLISCKENDKVDPIINQSINTETGTLGGSIQPIESYKNIKSVRSGFQIKIVSTNLTAITNENGWFLIPNSPIGNYQILISKEGYPTLNFKVKIEKGTSPSLPYDPKEYSSILIRKNPEISIVGLNIIETVPLLQFNNKLVVTISGLTNEDKGVIDYKFNVFVSTTSGVSDSNFIFANFTNFPGTLDVLPLNENANIIRTLYFSSIVDLKKKYNLKSGQTLYFKAYSTWDYYNSGNVLEVANSSFYSESNPDLNYFISQYKGLPSNVFTYIIP